MIRLRTAALSAALLAMLTGVFFLKQRSERRLAAAALVRAVRTGDSTRLSRLLHDGGSSNARDEAGLPLLTLAARRGDAPMVTLLIEAGADVNACSSDLPTSSGGPKRCGITPLYAAVRAKSPAVIGILAAAGADVNLGIVSTGFTPLMAAAYVGHTGMVRQLLSLGADVGKRDDRGFTALRCATSGNAGKPIQQQLAALLAQRGATY